MSDWIKVENSVTKPIHHAIMNSIIIFAVYIIVLSKYYFSEKDVGICLQNKPFIIIKKGLCGMEMEMVKKKYICIYMLKGMFRTTIGADTIQQLYELLEMKEVVSGAIDDLSDLEILEKIYADSLNTTGRLTVYKLDETFDPETADEFDDEYIVCKNGIV